MSTSVDALSKESLDLNFYHNLFDGLRECSSVVSESLVCEEQSVHDQTVVAPQRVT